ncbi:MAG: type III pantothenate kinase [Bacteroidales bacterium]|jgi:type III pantothenate kinase|nr:type III pantothenate kinase [Bacteroidales bacterium]
MNLVIDRGNTQDKVAVFQNNRIVFCSNYNNLSVEILKTIKHSYSQIINAIYSSVGNNNNKKEIISFLKLNYKVFDRKNLQTSIKMLYQTTKTLGEDRLAAIIGAENLYPQTDLLVIDCGSCITFDFINKTKEYFGGSISCGLKMKFAALHNFTANLPLLDVIKSAELIGNSTQNSILSGVINGTIAEIEGIIKRYKQNFPQLNVILTGGDAEFLSNNINVKHKIEKNLVLYGLNNIINNAKTNN